MRSGHRTDPARHTRERSFRSRSTIITCSAASFSEPRSSPAAASSGRVPLIGLVRMRSPSSGQEELRRRRDDRPAVADERLRMQRAERSECGCEQRAGLPRTAPRDAGRGSPGRRRRARSRPARDSTASAYSAALQVWSQSPIRNPAPPAALSPATRHAASGSGHGSGQRRRRAGGASPRARTRGRARATRCSPPGAKKPCSRSHASSRRNAPSGSWSSSESLGAIPKRPVAPDERVRGRVVDAARASSPRSSSGAMRAASSFPSSTPHWSKGLMSQIAACVKTLCS